MNDENTLLEKRVELSLLYDFYGELLKESQKEIFEDYILNDLSLAEIAQGRSISRQGVHDAVKRCSRQLMEYEEKLHLIERFRITRADARQIEAYAAELEQLIDQNAQPAKRDLIEKIKEKTKHIIDIL